MRRRTRVSVSGATKAMTLPATPTPRFDIFYKYDALTQLLFDYAAAHPGLVQVQSIGKSHAGRDLWVLTVTNFAKGEVDKKPAMWIDGAIHANEIQATEVVLYTAWYLCEMRQDSDVVKRLLDERTFYLMPMMSPDSRDAHMYEPNSTNTPRPGQRDRKSVV